MIDFPSDRPPRAIRRTTGAVGSESICAIIGSSSTGTTRGTTGSSALSDVRTETGSVRGRDRSGQGASRAEDSSLKSATPLAPPRIEKAAATSGRKPQTRTAPLSAATQCRCAAATAPTTQLERRSIPAQFTTIRVWPAATRQIRSSASSRSSPSRSKLRSSSRKTVTSPRATCLKRSQPSPGTAVPFSVADCGVRGARRPSSQCSRVTPRIVPRQEFPARRRPTPRSVGSRLHRRHRQAPPRRWDSRSRCAT